MLLLCLIIKKLYLEINGITAYAFIYWFDGIKSASRKRGKIMKKKLLTIMLATTMTLSFTACGSSSDAPKADSKTEAPAETAAPEKVDVTYQGILDEYTQKLADATPGLVDEFNSEAGEKGGDMNALAELCNAKVEKLAAICNQGVEEMAKLMQDNGDEYSTYEDWAGKLQNAYTTQAQQIQDAYTNAAIGQ